MPIKLRDYLQISSQKSNVTAGLLFCVKGTTDDEIYVLESDPAAPVLPVGLSLSTVEAQFKRNGTSTTPVLDTSTATNNRPAPSVQLAGDSLGPVAMDTGATGATVQRVTQAAPSKVNLASYNHTTPVTTSAYTEIIASTSAVARKVEIYDTSGEILILAFGAASSEVDQLYIPQGGNGPIELLIPASTRVSVKAHTANTASGYLLINTYN